MRPQQPGQLRLIQHQLVGSPDNVIDKDKQVITGAGEDDEKEFNEDKDKDDMLIEKLNSIEKMADLDQTFGKKGRVMEEEIKDLVVERNSLTDKKRRSM